ncbi:MAG: methyltransferase domain-containing protein [Candidatus Omnitrophota bacterium]
MNFIHAPVPLREPEHEAHFKIKEAHDCRFCGQALEEPFLDLGRMPLANAYLMPDALDRQEPKYPLKVFFCPECFLVQVPPNVIGEDIFSEYAYFSSNSRSWLDAANRYVKKIRSRLRLNKKSRVVEIASNDGYLLQYFKALGISVLGVEPAKNVAEIAIQKRIPTVVRFFGEALARDLVVRGHAADLIVANNVLAHVPDLNDFVRGLQILLKPQGTATIEFQHLMCLLKGNQFDTIYQEHYSYFSLITVQSVFEAAGLEVYDVEELPTHGGSLRIYVSHFGAHRVTHRIGRLVLREKKAGLHRLETYQQFASRIAGIRQGLLAFLRNAKKDKKIVLGYGAPAKGNTLLNYCKITRELLPATADVSPYKQGRYLPGSRIPIVAPDFIRTKRPDFLLILAWNLRQEIMSQMSWIRTWGGKFVVPIPAVRIYR